VQANIAQTICGPRWSTKSIERTSPNYRHDGMGRTKCRPASPDSAGCRVDYPAMKPEVRRIRADEGPQLRALRLRALAGAPLAFGSTLAREEALPEHIWHDRAAGGASDSDRVTFVAEREGHWLGLLTGLAADPDQPDKTEPMLVGTFVEPSERGHGVGVALVEAVIIWARSRRAASLHLWVMSTNKPAIALYAKCGFRRTGEQKPLGHAPTFSEVRMVRDLP